MAFGCCAKKDEGEKKPKKLSDRKCTDILCLIIFIVFVGILAAIMGLAIMTGEWASLVYEQDYLGQRCGIGTMSTKPKAFYPRIPRDLYEQNDLVQTGTVAAFAQIRLYALCVESCPSEFNIVNPEAAMVTDYGYDPTTQVTQALGTGTQKLWLSATPTVDIMNRCIPRSETSTDLVEMCAYPKCNSTEAAAVGAVCANTGSFVNGEWAICPTVDPDNTGSGGPIDCAAQTDTCKVRAKETTTMAYALSTSDEASAAMLASVANTVGGLFEIMSAISSASTMIIVGGILVPIVLAFGYMMLLFFFAKTIIYTLLVVLILSELVLTFVCFSRSGISFGSVSGASIIAAASSNSVQNVTVPDAAISALSAVSSESQWIYAVAFLLMAIITVITILTVLLARKKIAICAAIVQEATTVFISMPLLMFFPSLSTIIQILVCLWFVITMVLVQTQKGTSIEHVFNLAVNTSSDAFLDLMATTNITTPAAPALDPIAGLRSLITSPLYSTGCAVIVLFGFFTLVQFVQGIAWCTMSGATYYWYFFHKREEEDAQSEQTRVPISRSLSRVLFYHSGSVAFAAFVIATCDMLRALATYLEAQMGPTQNKLVKLAFKVLQCCLYCLKKTVKFVSYYGLVFVACQGSSFCMGCYKTFFFFLQNPGQVSINALVIKLLSLIATLASPSFCGVVFYYVIDGYFASSAELSNFNAMYPGVIIFVLAAIMTVSCMKVFECVITTIFVCCFQDKAEFGGKYMSDRLANAFHIKRDDKKKEAPKEASKEVLQDQNESLQNV